jgi:hypothetical protein
VTVTIEGSEPQVFEIDLARDGGGEAAKDAAIALPGTHTVKP